MENINNLYAIKNSMDFSGEDKIVIFKGRGLYFNTINFITICDSRKELITEVFSICDRFEKLFSRSLNGSDIWRINHADGEWTVVDNHTVRVIKKALYYSRISKGLFDVSIAPATSLWNLADASSGIPTDEMLASAAARIGFEHIEILENKIRIPKGFELELGGIAKGYIADIIAGYLREECVRSALIDLGGNIYALGMKNDLSLWNIGIRNPDGGSKSYLSVVSVSDRSVVTSGIYERNMKNGTELFHHILDPLTGSPVKNELASVTVVSENSVDADALSTVCMLSGLDRGLDLIESIPNSEAVFVCRTGEIEATSGIGKTVSYKAVQFQPA